MPSKILFVNATDSNRRRETEDRHPNLGLLYLASYLRCYGGFTNIQVANADHVSLELLKGVDVFGVSSITQHWNVAKQICQQVKALSDVPVVVGGYHISALPSNLTEHMDIGVVGEGEETILELAQTLENVGLNKVKLGNTKGIVFWNDGKRVVTARRDLIEPLDRIPFPARDLVEFPKSQVHCLISSRGCPYRCVFCSSSAFWTSVRYHSPAHVVAELGEVWRVYHPKVVGFADDLFAVDKKRLREISFLARREPWFGQMRFTCSARANLVDAETARLLRDLGVFSVSMGLESGSERILNYLKCGSVSVSQNRKAVQTLTDSGLKATGTFVIGSPTETRQEMMETLQFIKSTKLASFETYVLLPLPGTAIWDWAKAKGAVNEDMDWGGFEIYFEDKPDNRVVASYMDRRELFQVLGFFKKEERVRLGRRMVVQGVRHPLKALSFVFGKVGIWKKGLEH